MAIVHGDYKILYIEIAGEFKPIGCLTDNSFSETTGTIETTTRENTDGWSSAAPTNQGYSIPFAGVSTLGDEDGTIADYDALQNLKRTRTEVKWAIRSGEGGSVESGTGYITDLSNSAPVGGEVTFSGTILGSGLPVSTPQAAGDPPTNFRNSDPATTNCFVEWDKSITGAMQSYRVYQGGVLFREFIGDVDQGTLTGLVPATTYSDMTCRGFDGVEETPDSNVISFTTASQTSIVVIDNLLSTSPSDALSANQGRILNETKVSSVQEGANVTVDATDPINPIVASIQRPVVDSLISTAVDQSLSANQGTILNNTKLNDVFAGSNVTVDKTDPLAPIISSVQGTTAGTTRRVYFTGDALILSETFYETNGSNKGTVPSIVQQVTNGDNQTTFFAVDFIGAAASDDETLIGGNYTGHLEVAVNSQAGNQSYAIEIYIADDQGVPFSSGIVGAPIGDLGVEVLAIGYTGIFDIEPDNPTSIVYAFTLDANVDIIAGTRVRYHISATKEGTDEGNVTMSLYSGSDWLTYLDAPESVTTEGVLNPDDTITGATQYDVNVNFEANKIGKSGTPAVNQVAVFVDGKLAKGDANLTWDDTSITSNGQGLRALTTSALDGYAGLVGSHDTGGAFSMYATNGQTLFRFDESQRFAFSSDSKANILGGSTAGNEALTIDRRTADYLGIFKNDPTAALDVVGSGAFTGGLEVVIDPLADDGVGNRGYNDVRYPQLTVGNTFTGIGNTFNNGIGLGPGIAVISFNYTGITGSTGILTDSDGYKFDYENTEVLRLNETVAILPNSSVSSIIAGSDKSITTKEYVAISHTEGEMTGATKADNQVVISEANYGDGSAAVTGTLYFIKP